MTDSTDKLWQRAKRYIAAGQGAPARAMLEGILARDPGDTRAYLVLGGLYAADDHLRAAARCVRDAAASPPGAPELLLDLVVAAIQTGEMVIARGLLDQMIIKASASPHILMRAATQWQSLGEHAMALVAIEQARMAGAEGRDFHFYRAVQLGFNGRLPEAESELDRCVAIDPPLGRAFVQLSRTRKQTAQANHLSLIEAALLRVEQGSEDHAALEFARYKELEDMGHAAEAWQALVRGNALMHARLPYDSLRESELFDRLLETCTAAFVQAVVEQPVDGPQPIFVIGMPRSGTTVLERLLGNHSKVQSAGELYAFAKALTVATDHDLRPGVPDATLLSRLRQADWVEAGRHYLVQAGWRAHGKPCFVDKLPHNWMLAGLIHKALPRAKILHLVRDPMDTCFSNWRAYFGPGMEYAWAYDLDALAAHYRQYRRVMAHWHAAMPGVILDVDYSRLVRDPAQAAREVLAFCGLDDEAACVDITRNTTPSATLSMPQVRQPIHARAFEEWRVYAEQLSALRNALAW